MFLTSQLNEDSYRCEGNYRNVDCEVQHCHYNHSIACNPLNISSIHKVRNNEKEIGCPKDASFVKYLKSVDSLCFEGLELKDVEEVKP